MIVKHFGEEYGFIDKEKLNMIISPNLIGIACPPPDLDITILKKEENLVNN